MRVQSLGQEDPLEKETAIHPLQYSCLGNPKDREAWWAIVHGVAKRVRHGLVTKQEQLDILSTVCQKIGFFIQIVLLLNSLLG